MSLAFCCEICCCDTPRWAIERHGDAVITWSCSAHLPEVCERLQRPGEQTKLTMMARALT